MTLEIIEQTPEWIAVHKPAGVPCQPAHNSGKHAGASVLELLAATHPEVLTAANPKAPKDGTLLHRLDVGTSGILLFARSAEAYAALRPLWTGRALEKIYLCQIEWIDCAARISMHKPFRITLRLQHDPKSSKRMQLAPLDSSEIETMTDIYPIDSNDAGSTWLVRIHTGVMHQIRATVSILGGKIRGEDVYTNPNRTRGGGDVPKTVQTVPLTATDLAAFSLPLEKLREAHLAHLTAASPLPPPAGQYALHALWLRAPHRTDALGEGLLTQPKW